MAFTDTEKAQIRRYLGYPDVFRDNNPRLESAFDVIGARIEVATIVRADLAKIIALETRVGGTELDSSGIKKVDEIEFFEGGGRFGVRDEGRRLCGQLSRTFGVPLAGDVFGTGGYVDDDWMGYGNQVGGHYHVG